MIYTFVLFLFYFIFQLYNTVLVSPYINMNPPQVYTCSLSWTLLPLPSPYHPSGSSQGTSPKHPVSCIKPFHSWYWCFEFSLFASWSVSLGIYKFLHFFFSKNQTYLFIFVWLCWVFLVARTFFFLVAVTRDYSLVVVHGLLIAVASLV